MQQDEINPEKEQEAINQQTPVVEPVNYDERLKKAFEGKEDIRQLVRAIKNDFPDTRTGDLSLKITLIQEGVLLDEEILKAIEAL